jgi:hypothetical protein
LAAIRLISVHPSLFSMQQVRQRQGIGLIPALPGRSASFCSYRRSAWKPFTC